MLTQSKFKNGSNFIQIKPKNLIYVKPYHRLKKSHTILPNNLFTHVNHWEACHPRKLNTPFVSVIWMLMR